MGDIVTEIDGKETKNSQSVVREVLKKQVGQQVEIVVLRDGKRKTVSIVTEQMPTEPGEEKGESPEVKEWFGLRVAPVTPDLAKQLGLPKTEGVVIEGVLPGSVGQEQGLRKGDVIFEVNRQRVQDETAYRKAMQKAKLDQGVLLLVYRGGSTFFVVVKEAN